MKIILKRTNKAKTSNFNLFLFLVRLNILYLRFMHDFKPTQKQPRRLYHRLRHPIRRNRASRHRLVQLQLLIHPKQNNRTLLQIIPIPHRRRTPKLPLRRQIRHIPRRRLCVRAARQTSPSNR